MDILALWQSRTKAQCSRLQWPSHSPLTMAKRHSGNVQALIAPVMGACVCAPNLKVLARVAIGDRLEHTQCSFPLNSVIKSSLGT